MIHFDGGRGAVRTGSVFCFVLFCFVLTNEVILFLGINFQFVWVFFNFLKFNFQVDKPIVHEPIECELVVQSCLTLCNPIDGSLPGSSVYGILQEKIPEWVAIPFSRESSQLRDQAQVSCLAGNSLPLSTTLYLYATIHY